MWVHEKPMKSENKTKYLGDWVSSKCDVSLTVEARKSRGIGIINQLSSILSSISLGCFYFETALILRQSMLVNSIMVNSESWNFLNKKAN